MTPCHIQPIGPFTGAFRFLSNFFPSPVAFNKMEYGGSEMSQKDPKTRSTYNASTTKSAVKNCCRRYVSGSVSGNETTGITVTRTNGHFECRVSQRTLSTTGALGHGSRLRLSKPWVAAVSVVASLSPNS